MLPLVYDPERKHDHDLLLQYRVNYPFDSLRPEQRYAFFICCRNYQDVLDDIHHLPYVIKIDVCAHHCPEPDGIQWMTDYPKVSKCDDPRPWVPSVFKWALETPNNQQQNHESLPQVQAFVDALEQLLDEPHVGIQERQRTDTSPDNGIEPDESR
ncbi:unnamed protein product [Rotaria sp. Silwood1]|nr:unnamed protein product [Rotaria sp. Silwood1]CAF1482065.1 unnamed protein product [Rotaria sp. Silwood1]CAF1492955.1 unnamed protein product [Rotaria sp. Silwood1]CAF3592145.1 unnamed protein product [Rotaria sp. Silwood1]CAF3611319.1 unnamed protein product [Rotaria sp. Silwood1]